uniref:B30.2/SPRY domain-containing protein n=1 Tax=Myripristis murdjan TaxID=586833 RepID=A0A667ZJE5_9TELE
SYGEKAEYVCIFSFSIPTSLLHSASVCHVTTITPAAGDIKSCVWIPVSVQLDPSSSHPWLVVSADRLQVQEAARLQHSADSSQRFTGWSCVLGDRVITAGRHYWEVDVSHSGRWRLGVTSVSARRKQKVPMSPSTGYWILWQDSRLWACTEDPTELPGVAAPRLVGVYVDFDEGQVSFYNVDSRAHIYTFSHTFRHSLLPVFGCMDGDTVLKIIPAEVSVSAPLV